MSIFLGKQIDETKQTVFTERSTGKLDNDIDTISDLIKLRKEQLEKELFQKQEEDLLDHVSLYTKEKNRQITRQDYHFNFFDEGKCRNKTFSVKNMEHSIAKDEINKKLDVAIDELFKKIIVSDDKNIFDDNETLKVTLEKIKLGPNKLPNNDTEKLKSIQETTGQVAKDALKRLEKEYKEHAFLRFQKTFECHADFINSILYLYQQIETKDKDSAQNFKNNLLKYIEKIIINQSQDHTVKNPYLNGRYRELQGAIDPKDKPSTHQLNKEKTSLLITGILREKNKDTLELDDSHTMPFPNFFGWEDDPFKIKNYKKEAELEFTKTILEDDRLDKMKKQIDIFKNKFSLEEFIARSLSLILGLLARISSETEKFPKFINSSLDGLSENGDYKKQLGTAILDVLGKAFSENKTSIDYKSVVKANEPYFKETTKHIIKEAKYTYDTLSKQDKCLNRKPVTEKVKLLYKISLICDLWNAIEAAEQRAGCAFTKDLDFWKIVQKK